MYVRNWSVIQVLLNPFHPYNGEKSESSTNLKNIRLLPSTVLYGTVDGTNTIAVKNFPIWRKHRIRTNICLFWIFWTLRAQRAFSKTTFRYKIYILFSYNSFKFSEINWPWSFSLLHSLSHRLSSSRKHFKLIVVRIKTVEINFVCRWRSLGLEIVLTLRLCLYSYFSFSLAIISCTFHKRTHAFSTRGTFDHCQVFKEYRQGW